MKGLEKLVKTGIVASVIATAPKAEAILYDDFSSSSLNPTLWTESGNPSMSIGIDSGAYLTEQNTPSSAQAYLTPNTSFTTGDSFEFDVNVASGSGDYNVRVLIGGDQNFTFGVSNPSEFGNYHVLGAFNPGNLEVNVFSPFGSQFIYNNPLSGDNYTISFGSETQNGTMSAFYDNVNFSEDVQIPQENHPVSDNSSSLYLLGLGMLGLAALKNKK